MAAGHTCATIFTFKELVYRLATRRHTGWKWDKIVGAPSRCGTLATFAARSCGYLPATSPARSARYAPSLGCAVLGAIAFWGLFCLAPNTVAHAKDELGTFSPKPLDIHVQVNGFGKVSSADIAAALQSAAFEIWKHCPHTQLDGIDVYYRADHPQTDFKRTRSGRIGIGLSARDTHWAQYGFQFAHEFCHALANYGNNPRHLMRYPRQANLWLEESLCETASLFALRAMSRSWQNAPPYPAWRSYAPWMNDYVERRLALAEHDLPAGTSFSVWFHQNQSALRQNSDMRDRNTIIATQLLPIFESQPRGWEAVAFLNRDSSNPEESLAQRFVEWRSQCPDDLRPFVTRLAAVFAVKLERLGPRRREI